MIAQGSELVVPVVQAVQTEVLEAPAALDLTGSGLDWELFEVDNWVGLVGFEAWRQV